MLSYPSLNLTPKDNTPLSVVNQDDRAIMCLIDELMDRSGLTTSELAARLGVKPQTIYQYRSMKRLRPSVQWLARLVEVCGGRIWVEMPRSKLEDR